MKRFRFSFVLATGFALFALPGCSSEEQLISPFGLVPSGKPAPVDVSGTWDWFEEAKGVMPAEIATEFFGIEPEGVATHFTCHDEGTFTLFQDGATFAGPANQVGECTSKGGQVFANDFPFEVLNGRITGNSIHFDFSDPICPYKAALTVEDGAAVAMNGTGRCGPFGAHDNFTTTVFEASRAGG